MNMLRIQNAFQQKGVALAMLLWFIAAMSILVGGIVAGSKTDVKLVQLQLQQLQAVAIGDGASLLLLRDMMLSSEKNEFTGRGVFEQVYTLGTQDVKIRAIPVTGLIDLNLANESLLIALFSYGTEGDDEKQEQAGVLAENVIEWRDELNSDLEIGQDDESRSGRFLVIEDLMQVEGINRDIYDRVSRLVHTFYNGQDGVDPLSAPEGVLGIITGEEGEKIADMVSERSQNPFQDTGIGAGGNEEYIATNISSIFRVDASMTFSDGKTYQRTRWVVMGTPGMDGLPWQFIRTDPVIAIKGSGVFVQEVNDG